MTWSKSWGLENWTFEDLAVTYGDVDPNFPDDEGSAQVTLIKLKQESK